MNTETHDWLFIKWPGITMVFFCGLLWTSSAFPDADKPTIVMGSQLHPEKREHGRFIKLVYTEAFKRLGVELVYQHYPPARVSLLADLGELSRVSHYNKTHPILVRVKEPALVVRFSAFATDPTIELAGWDSLKGTPYRVEYRRGSKIVQERLSVRVPQENLSSVNHKSHGIEKILLGRADIYVHEEDAVMDFLNSGQFSEEMQKTFNEKTIHNVGVLEEQTIHAFLNVRHKKLAPQLSVILKAMKTKGLLSHYSRLAKTP